MDQISKMGQILKANASTKRSKSRNSLNSSSEAQKRPRKLWLQSIILTFFDSYLEAVLSRSDLLLFLNSEWLRERPITRMVTKYQRSSHIRVTRSKRSKKIFSATRVLALTNFKIKTIFEILEQNPLQKTSGKNFPTHLHFD